MRLAGVILAGGRGERLGGVDKGQLEIAGRRMIDRVAARLSACDPLIVAIGSRMPGAVYGLEAALEVPDLTGDYAGPLAGFAAAVDCLARRPQPPDVVLCVAVDTPALPEDFTDRLVHVVQHAPAAVASYAGQPYPTNSAWRFCAVSDLPSELASGTAPHSLKRLAARVGGIEVPWPVEASGDPFASVNTAEDREALELRLSRSQP